jgi:uncharacterized protein YlxP (DUF503 family)
MIIGYGMVDVFMEGVGSLKAKRSIVLKILDKTRNKYPVSVSEVAMQELWQRSRIGYCVAGSSRTVVERIVEQVPDFMESLHLAQVTAVDTGLIVEKGSRY